MKAVANPGTQSPLADGAYTVIRDRLITLEIRPGAAINEDELRRELSIGRGPVREAIKRLALEDLIEIFPRRGTFASEIQITDLAAISEVRVDLEGRAAYLAAQRISDERLGELNVLLGELDQDDMTDRDSYAQMELDARVHRFVYRCATNSYLEDTATRFLNLSLRIWHLVLDRLPHLTQRVHEHGELLSAIEQREAERAREIAAAHVTTFEQEIRTVL
jgi:DNA-binding GntR family transcriptional regulator